MNLSPRNVLFQIHMWVGLSVGILFILLGLSGSILVYATPLTRALTAPAPKATASGAPLPLENIVAAARQSAPQSAGQSATVTLPQQSGDPATVRFVAQRNFGPPGEGRGEGAAGRVEGRGEGAARGAAGPEGRGGARVPPQDIFVDPVSGTVLGTRAASQPTIVAIAHQMHEAMLLGQPGRQLVGWLGVGMFILGLSGLVLWWPKKGQWKFAFGVRRTAKGFRLYREIHGMAGIWGYIVFIFVTFTAIPIAFPQVAQILSPSSPSEGGPPPGLQRLPDPTVTPIDGAQMISADQAIDLAKQAVPDATIRSVTLPVQRNRAISIAAVTGDGPGTSTVYVDPYNAQVIETRAPQGPPGAGRGGLNWRAMHSGEDFGAVWEFLVFLVGLLPLVFVTTGAMMWFKKRQNRAAAGA